MEESKWHKKIQSNFNKSNIEVRIKGTPIKKFRTGDIRIGDRILELQHSPITKREIENRLTDYSSQHFKLNWLIDGTKFLVYEKFDLLLLYIGSPWFSISELFSSFEFIYAHVTFDEKDYIVKFDPRTVKNGTVFVKEKYRLKEFIENYQKDPDKISNPVEKICPCKLIIEQKPPGSGKTYGMVERILNPQEDHYDNYLILTKPHSAKEVIRREFEDQLKDRNIELVREPWDENNKYGYLFSLNGKEKLVILATGDSFIYRIGQTNKAYLDMFAGICNMIKERGPTKLGRRGECSFAGTSTKVDARTLLICDEATKFAVHYASAIGQIMFHCNTDAYIIGDILQSIEYQENMMTYLFKEKDPFPHVLKEVQKSDEIRRNGPNLVNFLNTVVKTETYEKHELPVPVASQNPEVVRKRQHEGEVEIMFLDMKPKEKEKAEINTIEKAVETLIEKEKEETDTIEKAVETLIEKIDYEIHANLLLPNDILIVFPFVSNNPFGDCLRDALDDFWLDKLEDKNYRKQMEESPYHKHEDVLEFFDMYDSKKEIKKRQKKKAEKKLPWLAFFHRSEEGKPVNTSESDYATRMVSIHAAQGDGRRLVITCQLSELAFYRFSHGEKNLIYDSLLNVSCSRAKTKQIIVFQKGLYDDITSRFRQFIDDTQSSELQPKIRISPRFPLDQPIFENYATIEDREWISDVFDMSQNTGIYKGDIIEHEHYIIRDSTFNFYFALKILCEEKHKTKEQTKKQVETVFRKISNLPIKLMRHKGYYKTLRSSELDCIPLIEYKGKEKECVKIQERCRKLRDQVFKKFAYQNFEIQELDQDLKNLEVFDFVLMWYMVSIFERKLRCHPKMNALWDIFASHKNYCNEDEKTKHYKFIKRASGIFDELKQYQVSNDGTWNFLHSITLGKPTGELPTGKFECTMNIPYCYTSEKNSMIVYIVQNMTSLRIDKIASYVSFVSLLASQPSNENGNNRERFGGKKGTICVIPIENENENQPFVLYDKDDIIEKYKPILVNTLTMYLKKKLQSHHENILEFARYHRENSAEAYADDCERFPPKRRVDYVYDSLVIFCNDIKPKKKKRNKNFEIENIIEELRETLEDNLDDTIDKFQKSIQ